MCAGPIAPMEAGGASAPGAIGDLGAVPRAWAAAEATGMALMATSRETVTMRVDLMCSFSLMLDG
jgi:hypothetical protein